MTGEIIVAHENTPKPSLAQRTMHSHDNYEIWYLISGDADFLVEGSCYRLLPGDLMLMRKGEVHMFRLRSGAPYERMHVNFDISATLEAIGQSEVLNVFHQRPLGKFNQYPAALFPNNTWRQDMERLCRAAEKDRLLYLLPLLGELNECFAAVQMTPTETRLDRAAEILAFINANLKEELSLAEICSRFFLSGNHLNRIFKEATGTTVWRYITIKRLFLAKEMLAAGQKPTKVARAVGFKDYPTFFRAFKKEFGASPKSSRRSVSLYP